MIVRLMPCIHACEDEKREKEMYARESVGGDGRAGNIRTEQSVAG